MNTQVLFPWCTVGTPGDFFTQTFMLSWNASSCSGIVSHGFSSMYFLMNTFLLTEKLTQLLGFLTPCCDLSCRQLRQVWCLTMWVLFGKVCWVSKFLTPSGESLFSTATIASLTIYVLGISKFLFPMFIHSCCMVFSQGLPRELPK